MTVDGIYVGSCTEGLLKKTLFASATGTDSFEETLIFRPRDRWMSHR